MNEFRLDRTAFRMGKHKDIIDSQRKHWQNTSMVERLKAAAYLNSVAYNYDMENPPRIDRTVFTMRKQTS